MKVSVIIPAAGSGQRFGEAKQFKQLAGRPLFFHTIIPFLQSDKIQEIILVVPRDEVENVHRDVISMSAGKPIQVVAGGERRQDSVKNGVNAIDTQSTLVCIHDAARPFVTEDLIRDSIAACEKADGAVVALPSKDTVKFSENGTIVKTIDRQKIWLAQTPQTFQKDKLIKALNNADSLNLNGTDESFLMESMGYKIKLVEGHPENFKVTTSEDWVRAEDLCSRRTQGTA